MAAKNDYDYFMLLHKFDIISYYLNNRSKKLNLAANKINRNII